MLIPILWSGPKNIKPQYFEIFWVLHYIHPVQSSIIFLWTIFVYFCEDNLPSYTIYAPSNRVLFSFGPENEWNENNLRMYLVMGWALPPISEPTDFGKDKPTSRCQTIHLMWAIHLWVVWVKIKVKSKEAQYWAILTTSKGVPLLVLQKGRSACLSNLIGKFTV